jgi:MSHA biogenesis protein MshN
MVAGIPHSHGRLGPLVEVLGKPLSLINQVLQNVEARQGGVALDGKPDAAGWSAQVKPVLSHQDGHSGRRLRGLAWGLVLLTLAGWLLMNRPMLMTYFQPSPLAATQHKGIAPPVVAPSAAAEPEVEAVAIPAPAISSTPQLTRSLFSAWQSESPVVVSPVPPRHQPVFNAAPAKAVLAPQVEGEFSIKPAETTAANPVVSVIEPPLEAANTAKQVKSNQEEPGVRGVVNKQVRPDQEVNLLIQRAVDHEQKGRLNEALVTLRQAINSYPQSEDARQLLAAYLFESKQDSEAVAVLQTGIKQYPGQIGLSKSLAKWQLSHGQPEPVLQTLKPVANLLIQDAESQWMLAMAYQQTGQHAAALPHFERATVLRPGVAQWMVAYAISLQAAGQSAQALQQLQLAYNMPLSERLSEFVSQRIRQLGGTVPVRSE